MEEMTSSSAACLPSTTESADPERSMQAIKPALLPAELLQHVLHASTSPRLLSPPLRSIVCARRHAASDAATPVTGTKATARSGEKASKRTRKAKPSPRQAKEGDDTSSTRDFDPTKQIFVLNRNIDGAAKTNRYIDAIRNADKIKRLGQRPNRITYLYLIRAMVNAGCHAEATTLFNEMATRHSVKPDIDICNEMLRIPAATGDSPWQILDYMRDHDIPLDRVSHEHLLSRTSSSSALEFALHQLSRLPASLHPSTTVQERIIRLAIQGADEPAIAEDLYGRLVQGSGVTVGAETIAALLRASAKHRLLETTRLNWSRLVDERAQLIDEGTCLDVLAVAAQHGDVELAHQVLEMLQKLRVQVAEHHLIPVLDAHLRVDRLEDALGFVKWMRDFGGDEVVNFAGVGQSFRNYILRPLDADGHSKAKWDFQPSADGRISPYDRLKKLRRAALAQKPVDPVLFEVFVYCACHALDIQIARQLLGEVAVYLGRDEPASALATSMVVNLAIQGNFVGIAEQVLAAAKRSGVSFDSPPLLEACIRLVLEPRSGTTGEPREITHEACTEAIQLLEDIKLLLDDAAFPSANAYRRLLDGLAAANDPRIEPMAIEAMHAGHRITLTDFATWPEATRKRLLPHLPFAERKRLTRGFEVQPAGEATKTAADMYPSR